MKCFLFGDSLIYLRGKYLGIIVKEEIEIA
jgi:hypothetical protein